LGIVSEYRIEEKFKHNILSVIFDSDSFFYAISDINNKLNIAVKYRLEEDAIVEIPKIIAKETLGDHYYSSVNVFSKSKTFTFVPVNEYNYDGEDAFLKNSFPFNDEDKSVDFCSRERLHIIHTYPNSYVDAFSSLKDDLKFKHLSLAYLEGIKKDGVFVTLYEKSLILTVRKNGQVAFYNQFPAPSLEDRMYFVMLAYDQIGLQTNEFQLFIDGKVSLKDELKLALSDYVENVEEDLPVFSNLGASSDLRDLYLASICE